MIYVSDGKSHTLLQGLITMWWEERYHQIGKASSYDAEATRNQQSSLVLIVDVNQKQKLQSEMEVLSPPCILYVKAT